MQILYNGVDISSDVNLINDELIDNAGGIPDSISLTFSDNSGLWSQWNPQKNDNLEVKEGSFSTGKTYIDDIGQSLSVFTLKALSIPQPAKTCRTQGWDNVRLMQIVNQIAARYGFAVKSYGITDYLYERVDQIQQPDFEFLAYRCMLEGYAIKIHDKTIIIYQESMFELQPVDLKNSVIPVTKIIGDFKYRDKSTDIYQTVEVRSQTRAGYILGKFTAPGIYGPTLPQIIYCSSQTEADRFARNIARYYNKLMQTMKFDTDINTGWAAATNLQVNDTGISAGKYFAHRVIHSIMKNKTRLILRRPLEGY